MNSKNTPNITTVGTSFLSEAGGNTSISLGKLTRLDPFSHMHSREWLFSGSSEIHNFVTFLTNNFVKIFLEITQLASSFHNLLSHKERRLSGSVTILGETCQTVIDKSLVKENTGTLEVVTSVTSNSLTSIHLQDAQALHNFVMMHLTKSLSIDNEILVNFTPCSNNLVIILSVTNNHIRSNDVSNKVEFLLKESNGFTCLSLEGCNLLINSF
mmetsp:Transcript_53860/g.73827  ORF Transcript_53860/g.73827 Transcript_53860/m.73827 type:complete len:213 (-) Transcript_53860:283-921(-)